MSESNKVHQQIEDCISWLSSTEDEGMDSAQDYERRIEGVKYRMTSMRAGDPVSDYIGFKAMQYDIILGELGDEILASLGSTANVAHLHVVCDAESASVTTPMSA